MTRTHVILIVAAIIAACVALAWFLTRRMGNMESVLSVDDARLTEIQQSVDEMSSGLPVLQEKTTTIRNRLAVTREEVEAASKFLPDGERQVLIAGRRLAESDLTLSESQLVVAAEVVKTIQKVQELLTANQAALKKLVVGKPPPDTAAKIRELVSRALDECDRLDLVSDGFTIGLDKFLSKQREHWLSMNNQVENLKELARGDRDFDNRFQTMTLFLELRGTSITNVGNVLDFMQTTPRKQREVRNSQRAILSAVK